MVEPIGRAPYPPAKLLKGAIILVDRKDPKQKTVVGFQYNPATLTRGLTPRYYQEGFDRFVGPAGQTIDVTVQLEASDGDKPARTGILPELAALELMVNPSSTTLEQFERDEKSNKLKVVPTLAPRALFVWGPKRVLPVRIRSLTVTEKQHNAQLYPTQADVVLKLDLCPINEAEDPDYQLLLTNLKNLESLSEDSTTATVETGLDTASTL